MDEKSEQYSFSKLSSWHVCPYGYMLRYEEHKEGIGNAFSSHGKFVHSIMERYAKGELKTDDLPFVYEWGFDTEVTEEFPYNKYADLRAGYYNQGLDFLKKFKGYEKYKILGVEEEFAIPIDDWTFVGIIDLVFCDESDRLIIRDYKSKASFKNESEMRQYARQLYLYSIYINQKYNRYPDLLQFYMFMKQQIISIDYNISDLEEALKWASDTVNEIRNAFNYPPYYNDFYCGNLCNFRDFCEFKADENSHRRGSGQGKQQHSISTQR